MHNRALGRGLIYYPTVHVLWPTCVVTPASVFSDLSSPENRWTHLHLNRSAIGWPRIPRWARSSTNGPHPTTLVAPVLKVLLFPCTYFLKVVLETGRFNSLHLFGLVQPERQFAGPAGPLIAADRCQWWQGKLQVGQQFSNVQACESMKLYGCLLIWL